MSYKCTVKISAQGVDRYVELERAHLSYAKLRSETERRTKQQGQWYLQAGSQPINTDQDLLTAVVVAEGRGAQYLDVQLLGGSAPRLAQPAYTPSPTPQTYSAPPPTYQQPTYTAPAYTPPPVQAAPVRATSGFGTFTLFEVYGNPGAPADKPAVQPEQIDDGYVFTPVVCKNSYSVEVIVEPVNAESTAIKFRLSREGGASTQSFKLGFSFGIENVSQIGNTVKVSF